MSIYTLGGVHHGLAQAQRGTPEADALDRLTNDGWLVFWPNGSGLQPHVRLFEALKLLEEPGSPCSPMNAVGAALVSREALADAELLTRHGCLVFPPVAVLMAAFLGLRTLVQQLQELAAQRDRLDEVCEEQRRELLKGMHILADEVIEALIQGAGVSAQKPLQLGTAARALGLVAPDIFQIGVLAGSLMRRGLVPVAARTERLDPQQALQIVFVPAAGRDERPGREGEG